MFRENHDDFGCFADLILSVMAAFPGCPGASGAKEREVKRRLSRVWAVLACGVAFSCGKSKSFVGDEHGPAGGSAGAGAGGTSSGGEADKGGSTPAGGSSGAGGAERGGAEQGGTAGIAEAPPLRACILNRESTARADFCEMSQQCPASTTVVTTCRFSGDTWWCECSGTTGPELYEVSGLESPLVCEEVAALCASRKKPIEPEECTSTVETREPTSCKLERGCVRSLENADGVDATITSHDDAHCVDDGSGSLACSCTDEARVFQVSGTSGIEACDTMIEVCAVNLIPIYVAPVCFLDPESVTGSDGCQAFPTCVRVGNLGDGTAFLEYEHGEINCTNALGGAVCSCVTNLGQAAQFTLESPTDGSATCERLAPVCGEIATNALSEIECEPGEASVSDESCFVNLACAQSVEFGGERLEVFGTLAADCVSVGDRFVCNCIAHADNAQIEVEAGTPSDACAAAMTECQDAVTVTIGDGVILVPVPLP
jgi:hypothetical protein